MFISLLIICIAEINSLFSYFLYALANKAFLYGFVVLKVLIILKLLRFLLLIKEFLMFILYLMIKNAILFNKKVCYREMEVGGVTYQAMLVANGIQHNKIRRSGKSVWIPSKMVQNWTKIPAIC